MHAEILHTQHTVLMLQQTVNYPLHKNLSEFLLFFDPIFPRPL